MTTRSTINVLLKLQSVVMTTVSDLNHSVVITTRSMSLLYVKESVSVWEIQFGDIIQLFTVIYLYLDLHVLLFCH